VAASRHQQSSTLNAPVKECGKHFLQASADVRDNANACRSKRSLLGLRDHAADEKLYAKLWKQLRPFEGIPHYQRFLLPMLLLLIRYPLQNRLPVENGGNSPLP
jgi:hypothetical protein